MRAFHHLSPSRQYTMGGETHITISEIFAYCRLYGIDEPDERAEFCELIQAIDYAYLSEREKRREQEKAGKTGPEGK